MRILAVESLAIPDLKVIRFGRFPDHRGYFCEHFRKSDFAKLPFFDGFAFVQSNESFSNAGTVRGLHFQWNPYVGKLVRTVQGHMVDLVLDIREGSPTFGKILAHDMPANPTRAESQWIWVPPGFAHGNFFSKDTTIEYFCTGEYNPAGEAGISPLAKDLDWSLCDPCLKKAFQELIVHTKLISPKDRDAFSVAAWNDDERSRHFTFGSDFRSLARAS